ncbi:MAG TPA: beta-N-acetylhexosaminidase [Terracidiphilus sp.]|nr:beta-N-acetylhexosaminidase [Terracidiphilus sp.]HEV2487766.1 beta-N-acetylhexosaminidase [Terracidiphilus sp.]
MTANLRRAAGSLLVVGLGGTELTGLERAWLRLVRPAGIILFRRNIADARQTLALLEEATGLGAAHGLRCVDVEGGTVDRLRYALAAMPSAQSVWQAAQQLDSSSPILSQKARKDGAPRALGLTREHGELVAQAVKAFGFNTTLAPVLDLGLPDSIEVMGTRTAAATAAGVVEYGRGFLSGLAAHGAVGCGKHFPGLGGGTRDSHLETPVIRRSERKLWNEDLAPYRELRDELPMVMVNHAAYPETPGKALPASVSPYWIATVLRRRIGYSGIVFSDDLEMGGILKFMRMEEAVVAGVRAGMDLMEICHSPELILRAYEALVAEGERSRAFAELLEARARRTARLRAKLFVRGTPKALSEMQFEALRVRILRFGETIASYQPTAEVQTT